MSAKWKEQALQVLPELTAEIEGAESLYQMWISIRDAFEDAYDESRNESLIRKKAIRRFSGLTISKEQ